MVTISLVAFSRLQVTTKYDSDVQGVNAKNGDNNPGRGSTSSENNSKQTVVSPTGAKSKIQPKTVTTKETETENEVEKD